MALAKLALRPGVVKDDTALQAEGTWVDSDKVRFRRGWPENIGGWESVTASQVQGVCRGLHVWADLQGNPAVAIGTHKRAYVYYGGGLYDVTPVRRLTTTTDGFSTTAGSAVVTVTDTAHGSKVGDDVNLLTTVSIGGLTLNGGYTVASSADANTYTITAAAAASGSVAAGGGSVVLQYLISPGQQDSVGALGYGTGAYGIGLYGQPQPGIDPYPRTWAVDNWGQNGIMNPRGGGLYEWVPTAGVQQLVQHGGFDSADGWTAGTGWAIAGNAATKTAGVASVLSQALALSVGATPAQSGFYILLITLTRSAGTLQIKNGTTNVGAAISASGTYAFLFTATSTALNLSADAAFGGSISSVSVKAAVPLRQIANAPTQVSYCYVLPDLQMLVALGANDQVTGVFDPMLVRWGDQADNTQWTAAITNLAGQYRLSEGSRIVAGKPGRAVSLIWTDTALYTQQFLPGDLLVFAHKLAGVGCGLIGPNAAAVIDAAAFWWSNNGSFYQYVGGVPEPLPCPLKRYLAKNMSPVQGEKVYAFTNAQFNEVWWLYPDARDGNECSRYVVYNYVEKWWAVGTFDRTAWHDAGVLPAPIAISSGGTLYYHERPACTADGGAYVSYATSAFMDIDDGTQFSFINRIIPDFETNGALQILVSSLNEPNGKVTTKGPFTITASKRFISPRLRGRQIAFTIQNVQNGVSWRFGAVRVNRAADGKR